MSGTAVGVCIGSSASYVVVARQGGVETLFNEFDDRNTPTCVSFNGKMRYIGYAAKQQPIKDVRNRLCAFTRFIGRTFNDGMNEIKTRKYIGCDIEAYSVNQQLNKDVRQRVGFRVAYCGKEILLCVEQVYAMQLIKLKEIAEIKLGKKVVDVVINVPTNATDSHRRAILDAAKIANVNCVRIINDTTATALAYAFSHPISSESCHKERFVVFVDMGYSHLQSSIVSFKYGEIRVIASSCDDIGGYDFDRAIYDHIKNEFETKHRVEVKDNTKTALRLMEECEKLKKSMNASNASIPLNIDCFMGDVDLSTMMKRSEFEALCKDILSRVRKTLERLRDDGGVRLEDIDDVEIVGGSTCLSAIKQIIKEVFHKELRVSLNAEEAVAKGCAVQAAIISRVEQFKEIKIVDLYPHKITLRRDDERLHNNVYEHCLFPATIKTFDWRTPFKLFIVDTENVIGIFNVPRNKDITKKGELSLDANGLFTLCLMIIDDKIKEYFVKETFGYKRVTTTICEYLPIETMILDKLSSHIHTRFKEEEEYFIKQSINEGERVRAKNSVQEYVNKILEVIRGLWCDLLGEAEKMLNHSDETSETYLGILKYLKKQSDDIIKYEIKINNRQLKPFENERKISAKNSVLEYIDKIKINCSDQCEFNFPRDFDCMTTEGYKDYRENLKSTYETILSRTKLQSAQFYDED